MLNEFHYLGTHAAREGEHSCQTLFLLAGLVLILSCGLHCAPNTLQQAFTL